MTAFQDVKRWVENNKNSPGYRPSRLRETLNVNYDLINEESDELLTDISKTMQALSDDKQEDVDALIAGICKEVADTVVVCYHLLAQLGLDGDVVTKMVTDNNDLKLNHPDRSFNEAGKLVLKKEDKAVLKAAIKTQMIKYVKENYKGV